jgi:hypothetical protein
MTLKDLQFISLPDESLCYLKMPKVGCTSIIRAMMERAGCVDASHLNNVHFTFKKYLREHSEPPLAQEPLVFTFVRSPITRVISFYQDKIVRGDPYIADRLQKNGLYQGMDFEDMIERVAEADPVDLEPHIRPMHVSLVQDGGIIPHFIGKIEYIDVRWPILANTFGLPKIGQSNTSAKTPLKISRASYDLILRKYDLDFRYFRYHKFTADQASRWGGFTLRD